MKIAIVGIGYVGLANAIMLDQLHNVVLVDVDESKVKKINQRKSPISDSMIDDYLINVSKDFAATKNFEKAYKLRELIIIATPTNYDVDNDSFDTSSIEKSIQNILKVNKDCIILIKSTIPVGYTNYLRKIFKYEKIFINFVFWHILVHLRSK